MRCSRRGAWLGQAKAVRRVFPRSTQLQTLQANSRSHLRSRDPVRRRFDDVQCVEDGRVRGPRGCTDTQRGLAHKHPSSLYCFSKASWPRPCRRRPPRLLVHDDWAQSISPCIPADDRRRSKRLGAAGPPEWPAAPHAADEETLISREFADAHLGRLKN